MPAIRQLVDLQAIDLDLDRRNARLAEIAARLGDRRALDRVTLEVTKLGEATNGAAAQQRAVDDAIAALTERIEQADAKLYGGTIRIPRELEDLQADIAQLNRQRDDQEMELLEAMEELEPIQARRDEIAARLAVAEKAWSADQASMKDEQSALKLEVAALSAARMAQASDVPPGELALYEQVRARHPQGKGVAFVHNAMCASCRVGLPSGVVQSTRTAVVPIRCPSCGLILLPE